MSAEGQPSVTEPSPKEKEQWGVPIDADSEPKNGGPPPDENIDVDRGRGHSEPESSSSQVPGSKSGTIYREKQIKANKVYIGGLPESTRQEDLQACFGKIGRIVGIELKLGYGFVEFDSREAAEESVAEYHEGSFMGNKIRVELSHGGGRTAKFAGEPGACFKCGQHGHWARECPNHVVSVHPYYSGGHKRGSTDSTLLDRISQPGRDGPPMSSIPPPMKSDYRDGPPYRDDRHGGPPDRRFYDYPPIPPRDIPPRDYRYRERPGSPPRDYRDYPAVPPPRASREYDDYRRDFRGPPIPPPASRYDRPPYYADYDHPPRDAPYPPRSYSSSGPPPLSRDPYDRGFDKRLPPPGDRYPYPPVARSRSPVGPPRGRDDYDRPPPRDFVPAPPRPDYRGRGSPPPGPPRHADYGGPGYRRRSLSPLPRSVSNGHFRAPYPPGGGPPMSSALDVPASGYRPGDIPSGSFAPQAGYSSHSGPGGRYTSPAPGTGPGSSGPSPAPGRSGGGGVPTGRGSRDDRDRDYARSSDRGREAVDSSGAPNGGSGGALYRRA